MLMIYDTGETVHYRVPAVNCAKNGGDDVYNPVHAFCMEQLCASSTPLTGIWDKISTVKAAPRSIRLF